MRELMDTLEERRRQAADERLWAAVERAAEEHVFASREAGLAQVLEHPGVREVPGLASDPRLAEALDCAARGDVAERSAVRSVWNLWSMVDTRPGRPSLMGWDVDVGGLILAAMRAP